MTNAWLLYTFINQSSETSRTRSLVMYVNTHITRVANQAEVRH